VEGLRRVWTLTGSENTAALRLQEKFGFRLTNAAFYGIEMEIRLPLACAHEIPLRRALSQLSEWSGAGASWFPPSAIRMA
jgi:hypothetical protein